MKLAHKEKNGITIFSLTGNVMGGPDGIELEQKLQSFLSTGKKKIVVDLAGVKFMNSSGLGMMVKMMTAVRNAGGQFKLANTSEKIETLLSVTRLNTVLEHHSTLQNALKTFK